MFGLFKGVKKVEKISIQDVVATLSRRFWEFELMENRSDVVIIKGKYRNYQRDFHRLFLHFVGDKIQFKDERGRSITHIPNLIARDQLFPQLKNVLNVL